MGEARILATEAARIYLVLADLGITGFGADDARKAEERRDAVLKQLPLDFR